MSYKHYAFGQPAEIPLEPTERSTAPHVPVQLDDAGHVVGAHCRSHHGGSHTLRAAAPNGYYQCAGCGNMYHSTEVR